MLSFCSVIALSACTSADRQARSQQQDKEKQQVVLVEQEVKDSAEYIAIKTAHELSEAKVITVSGVRKRTNLSHDAGVMMAAPRITYGDEVNNETYHNTEENRVFNASVDPVSTFSVDVDTGSYTNVRRMLNQGVLPPSDAVRIEEFVNYFDYEYNIPNEESNGQHPFSIDTQIAKSPWDTDKHLLRIALKGKETHDTNKKRNKNLVFLLDVSGSMNQHNKLPLVKKALKMLLSQLTESDSVAIVVYAGASGVVLEPTAATQSFKIEAALDKLSAGGSTNGGQGIELAYKLAQSSFKKDGVNRVILATDGDFNVGTVNHEQLIDLIVRKRNQGIELTTLGFGQGNYNDHLMEQLANKGNGNYAYIDTLNEARKVLVEELEANMSTIAKDTKIQIEFNPNVVSEYRLIGYENRKLAREDFNNDKVDAGEIGEGHTVTAFYEIILKNSESKYNDELRYSQNNRTGSGTVNLNEVAQVKLRYKAPNSDQSQLITQVIEKDLIKSFSSQSSDFKFATAVIEFAELLRNGKYANNMAIDQVLQRAQENKGKDEYGSRSEFISLVRMAKTLNPDMIISYQQN